MGSLLLATAGKHRQAREFVTVLFSSPTRKNKKKVASERAEKSRADDTRVLRCFGVDLAEVVRQILQVVCFSQQH